MKVSGTGEIDIRNKQIDFTLLVAPQKTMETVLGHIPLIGGTLETINTIPLRVGGTIDDIHVLPLAPSAVGFELKEIMKQTLDAPMKLVHMDKYHKLGNSD